MPMVAWASSKQNVAGDRRRQLAAQAKAIQTFRVPTAPDFPGHVPVFSQSLTPPLPRVLLLWYLDFWGLDRIYIDFTQVWGGEGI